MPRISKEVPHPVDVHLGARLTIFRKAKKLTQAEVGELLGVRAQQVAKYEQGKNRMMIDQLYTLSQFFRVPIQEFFSVIEQPNTEGTERAIEEVFLLQRVLGLPLKKRLQLWELVTQMASSS